MRSFLINYIGPPLYNICEISQLLFFLSFFCPTTKSSIEAKGGLSQVVDSLVSIMIAVYTIEVDMDEQMCFRHQGVSL